MPQLRVALAQTDITVGDLAGNVATTRRLAADAAAAGAHLLALPELTITGYPPEDLVLRESFVAASRGALDALATDLAADGLAELAVVVGYVDETPADGARRADPRNAAALLYGGQVVARYFKHHLPNYGVFDEARYFVPGDTLPIIRLHGIDVAITICEDLWQDGGPFSVAAAAQAGLVLSINASPYERSKDDVRLQLAGRRAIEARACLAYVNTVGGQDELVYDGDSMVVAADGTLIARGPQFAQTLMVTDLDLPAATGELTGRVRDMTVTRVSVSTEPVAPYQPSSPVLLDPLDEPAEVWAALVTGLRDYVHKNGFATVLLGVSGGIDSSVVAAIACDAIGAEHVYGVSNPSDYSTQHSRDDAAELARRTGLHLVVVPIAPMVQAFSEAISLDGLAAENLQARIRAVIWMGLSNQDGHNLVLACGNKSELATGYSTLYGDAVGGFAPIKDVPKTLVWELARWRNAEATRRGETPPIPQHTIDKLPSAELRPDQLDTDSLPPYDILDAILADYIDGDLGATELVTRGHDRAIVERVIGLVDRAEFKRRQYPPGTKISAKAFGRDRRLPITNRWRESARQGDSR